MFSLGHFYARNKDITYHKWYLKRINGDYNSDNNSTFKQFITFVVFIVNLSSVFSIKVSGFNA